MTTIHNYVSEKYRDTAERPLLEKGALFLHKIYSDERISYNKSFPGDTAEAKANAKWAENILDKLIGSNTIAKDTIKKIRENLPGEVKRFNQDVLKGVLKNIPFIFLQSSYQGDEDPPRYDFKILPPYDDMNMNGFRDFVIETINAEEYDDLRARVKQDSDSLGHKLWVQHLK